MSADLRSLERDSAILGLLEKFDALDDKRAGQIADLSRLLANHIKRQDDELAELRDAVLALSNRLEAVTRTVGSGLHSVKSGYGRECFSCHGTGQAAPDIHAACSVCGGSGRLSPHSVQS